MGGQVEAEDSGSMYLLHGWRGNEDEDVNVESSEGSSQGEVGGLRKLTVSAAAGLHQPVTSNKVLASAETLAEETSDARAQECDSAFVNTGTFAGQTTKELEQVFNNVFPVKPAIGKKIQEEAGAVFLPGESSSMKKAPPLQQKRLNDGKRLDARRFRNHFAAKLSGSKRLNSAEGKGQGDVGCSSADKVVSNGSLELSGGRSSTRGRSKTDRSSSSEQEQETLTLHVNLQVEHDKSSDFFLNAECDYVKEMENCEVFSRNQKQVHEGATQDRENSVQARADGQEKNGVQVERTIARKGCLDSETRSDNLGDLDMTLDCCKKRGDHMPERSKRARKDNTQKDYIPWSAFERFSLRRSESSKAQVLLDSAFGTGTDCNCKASKGNLEKEGFENSDISLSKETRVMALASNCEDVGSVPRTGGSHQKDLLSVINIHDTQAERKQSTLLQGVLTKQNADDLSQPAGHREPKITDQNSPSSSEVQDNDIQPSQSVAVSNINHREVDSAGLWDGVETCGGPSGPMFLSEPGLMHGIGVSKHGSGIDLGLTPMEKEAEGTMPDGQCVYSKMHLRKDSLEHFRISMTEGTGSDNVPCNQKEGTEIIQDSNGMDDHDSVCNRCKREGKLICCDGKNCKITFHIGCLDPPLMDVPPNDWYCPDCAYKRIVCGMHSVSKGLESIWDVKEGILDDKNSSSHKACCILGEDKVQQKKLHEVGEGLGEKRQVEAGQDARLMVVQENDGQKQGLSHAKGSESDGTVFLHRSTSSVPCAKRLYFVKYKGVAHAHNVWLQESQVLKEAPKLLNSFKKKLEQGKAPRWDPEWAKPCRVIGKRVTMLSRRLNSLCTGEGGFDSGSCVEWCIKWENLGYEFCTWEPADRAPLDSMLVKELIKSYESRLEKAKERERSGKVGNLSAIALTNLQVQPAWMKGERLQHDLLEAINKLRRYWQKHTHGIVVNETHQERIITTLGFLVCLLEEFRVARPSLVVVPPPLLGQWKAAFQKWMPTANVIVYAGTKEAREIIQRYEFYNEDGIYMAQVALTSFDTLNLDLEYMKGLNLEALIVDEYQRLKGTKTSKSLRHLTPVYRLLLLSEPIKDTADEYHHLLSVLSNLNEPFREKDRLSHEDSETLAELKTRVTKHIAYESKQDSTEVTSPKEFWVPVKMTAFQVEQYCKLLIDKSDTLARSKRGDIVSTPHELLLKIRECCNHPYLVNPSFQESLTDLSAKELLDFGIQASGKLKLLDLMLCEAKSSRKRVVIITQIHLRSEKASQMEILDDYMRQQFGVNSYERLDGGLPSSKKMAAVQRFNAMDSECFVFLLDRRACGSAIKLRSVNCIVIFDSDWNPQTDIQALLRMHPNGDFEQVAICRFYCPHTVEERVLISARKSSDLDNNHHNFTQALCQKLLRWGAQKNFEFFDSFSGHKNRVKITEELMYSTEIVNFFLGKDNAQSTSESHANNLHWETALCPRQAGQYNKGFPLYGETDEELVEEETVSATDFWTELLRDRQVEAPDGQVRELRARKKVQYREDSFNIAKTQGSLEEEEESRRKKRKVADTPELSSGISAVKGGKGNPVERECSVLCTDLSSNALRVENMDVVSKSPSGKSSDNGEKALQKKKGAFDTTLFPSGSEKVHVNKTTKEKKAVHGGLESSGNEGTSESNTGVKTEQQQLLLSMKPDLDRLCQALQFQVDTAGHVEQLLFSVGSFFKLPKEKSLLHAIELSLCWLAAEQQHYSIDRHATLALAETCFGVQLDKIDTVYTKLEERWKKRFEQGAQQSLGSRGQESDMSQRADEDPIVRIPDREILLQRDKPGLLQAPISSTTLEDPRLICYVHKGQDPFPQRDVQRLKQAPVNPVILEQQQVAALSDMITTPCHSERHFSKEQRLHISNASSFQESQQVAELPTESHRVPLEHEQLLSQNKTMMKEKQRSERVQVLINAQKTQIRNLDRIEQSYRDKLKQHYESACLKVKSSKKGLPGESEKLVEGFRRALSMLAGCFRVIRSNLIKKQYEEREKGNRLITSQMERMIAGEDLSSSALEKGIIDISERRIYDSLPQGLKAALENGDLGAVCSTLVMDRTNVAATIAGDSSLGNSATQSSLASKGPGQQALSRATDNGPNTPTTLMQSQPGSSNVDVTNPQLHVSPQSYHHYQQQHQRHHQQKHLPDCTEQTQAQQAVTSGLQEQQPQQAQAQQMVTSGLQEQQPQQAIHQQPQLSIPHPQPLLSPPSPSPSPSPSPPLPLPPQPEPRSQPQPQPQPQSLPQPRPLSPQPQLQPELQQNQPLQLGAAIPSVHGQQQIDGIQTSLAYYPNELAQTLSTSFSAVSASSLDASLPATPPYASSSRGGSGGTSTNRILQIVQSRMNQPYQNDPLAQEFLRLRKEQEKIKSTHEGEKDRIKAQFMKELEVLSKKYEGMLQEEDSMYTQKATTLELNLKKVEMNRRLAEVFRLKNAHDSTSTSNAATFGQDVHMLAGVSQAQSYQQQSSLMVTRAPVTPQGIMTPPVLSGDLGRCILPSMSTVGLNNSPIFERPLRTSLPSTSGAPLAGPLIGASCSYSQGQSSNAITGFCLQSAHAGTSAGPMLGQSRPIINASGQSSFTSRESNLLLALRATTHSSGHVTQPQQRSVPSVVAAVPNSFSYSPTSAATTATRVQTQNTQATNLIFGGSYPHATSNQFSECSSGRISTCNVTTYSTAVTPQSNTNSFLSSGDTVAVSCVASSASETNIGMAEENYLFLGVPMPLPDFSADARERLAYGNLAVETSRPPTEEPQVDESRCMIYASQATDRHANQDTFIQTSFELLNAHTLVINGLGSTHNTHPDEGRNSVAFSDLICLSDDD